MQKLALKILLLALWCVSSIPSSAQWIGPSGGTVNDLMKVGSTLYAVTSQMIHISNDAGATWSETQIPGVCGDIFSIDVSGSMVVIGLSGSSCGSIENVYISMNGGVTWAPKQAGGTGYVYDVLIDGAGIYAIAGSDLRYSADGGLNWISKTNPGGIEKIEKHGGLLYGFGGNSGVGIQVSADGGTSWTPINNGLTNTGVKAFYFDGTTMIAGVPGDGIYISTNFGANWTLKNNGLGNMFPRSVFINGANLYAGTEGGLFHSSNGGNNWAELTNGFSGSASEVTTMVALSGTDLLIANGYSGLYKSLNSGASWSPSYAGIKATNISQLIEDGGNLYAASYNGIFMSSDEGASWIKKSDKELTRGLISHNNILYGISGVFGEYLTVSTDNGVNWIDHFIAPAQLTDLLFVGDELFVTSNGGLFRSTDFGVNWQTVDNRLTWKLVSNSTYIYAGGNGEVYRSADGGDTWSTLSGGNSSGNSIHYMYADGSRIFSDGELSTNNGDTWSTLDHPGNMYAVNNPSAGPPKFMFGSSYNNFSESYDNGNTWEFNSEGFIKGQGHSITKFLVFNNQLYLATSGHGIYKRPLPALPVFTGTISNYTECYGVPTNEGQPINVGDAYTPVDSLDFTFSSNNNSVISNFAFSVDGVGSPKTMNVLSNSNWTMGTATITLKVTNYDNLSVTKTFTYQVGNNTTLPLITLQDLAIDSLICSATGTGYEWSLDGQTILGATTKKIEITTDGDYFVRFTDANGCVSPFSAGFTYDSNGDGNGSTGIVVVSKKDDIHCYPNPASQVLNLNWDASRVITKIRLLNSMGSEIYQGRNNSKENAWQINLENYQKGLYWVELSNNEEKYFKKIVVE